MFLKIIFTQPFLCFWVNQVYMFLSQHNIFVSWTRCIFISFPVGFVVSQLGFLISLVENLLLRLTRENFWKIYIFPGESSSPIEVLRQGVTIILLKLSGLWNMKTEYTTKEKTMIILITVIKFSFLLKNV